MKGSPAVIAVVLRRRALALEREVREAEKAAAQHALQIARMLSSGPYSSAQLRRMGHPYSAARPRPPADPAIINRQTGRFLAGWRIQGPRKTTKGLVTKLINDAPQAARLDRGTSRMIARPIRARIMALLAGERRRLHDRAIRKGLSG